MLCRRKRSATHSRPVGPRIDQATRHADLENLRKWRSRLSNIRELGIELAEPAVAQDEPVIGVKQHETVGNRFDSRLNHAAQLLAMRRQFCPFDNAAAKQLESMRHRADFIGG